MPDGGIDDRFELAARRLMERCGELAQITDEPGRTTRPFLSPATREAHDRVAAWMEEAGLAVRVDAAGNIVGRLRSNDDNTRVVLVGSHLDTVPNAGRYDGILGVLAGIAVAHELQSSDAPLKHHLDVIGFSEEEGVRFGVPFIGSLAAIGQLPPEMLDLHDRAGTTLRAAISTYGLDPDRLPAVAYPPGSIAAFVEAHIEQGPALEVQGAPLGVVSAIAGQTRLQCRVTGEARHAGTTPMPARKDALAAAAAIVLDTEALATTEPGLVATVGTLTVEPNATNCIAGGAVFSLDMRHADDAIREQAIATWRARAATVASERGVQFEVLSQFDQNSIPCDEGLASMLAGHVVVATGMSAPHLPSGAGHDAMILARVAPIAMLFVRCAGGISHHPDETVRQSDVARALQALTGFVRGLCDSETTKAPRHEVNTTHPGAFIVPD